MKKLISIIMSVVLMITMLGAFSASAEIIFEDSVTFYEEFRNADGVPCQRYYKTIDGIVYSCVDNPDSGLSDAEVINIMPAEKNTKVEIAGTIKINDETVKVTSINFKSPFNLNSNVEEIVIGDNITSVKGLNGTAFLKKVTIGKNVCFIKDSFHHCDILEVEINKDNRNFVVEDGALYQKTAKEKILVSVLKTVSSYEVKSGITSVVAPFGNGELPDIRVKSITINGNLNTLAIGKMKKLNKINIGSNVKQIKNIDLTGAKSLKTVDFSRIKVNSIKAVGVTSLNTVALPAKCKIVKGAFSSCKRLEKVKLNNVKKAPDIKTGTFKNTKKYIKFYVKNRKVAKSLKIQLKKSGVKSARIYVGKKLIYKNVK